MKVENNPSSTVQSQSVPNYCVPVDSIFLGVEISKFGPRTITTHVDEDNLILSFPSDQHPTRLSCGLEYYNLERLTKQIWISYHQKALCA